MKRTREQRYLDVVWRSRIGCSETPLRGCGGRPDAAIPAMRYAGAGICTTQSCCPQMR